MPSRTRVSRSFWQNGKRVVTFFTRKEREKMDKTINKNMQDYLIVPRKLAIERLTEWLIENAYTVTDLAGEIQSDKKERIFWQIEASKAIKSMEGNI
jgi:hypothetical protein